MPETSPQFGTAEYASESGKETCKSCKQPLTGSYYRINGSLACENCANQLQAQLPKDSHSAFVRGLLFGVGGAILGLILYAGFGILTGLVIGYVSLAVGFIVGKAIKFGSGGLGGRRYQIAAAIFTYAAVSMAAIPMGISQIIKVKKSEPSQAQQPAPSAGQTAANDTIVVTPTPAEPKQPVSMAVALGMLALAGLASPFLELQDPIHGIIGLVILAVGIRIAWRLTAGPQLEILGPFRASVAVASPPSL